MHPKYIRHWAIVSIVLVHATQAMADDTVDFARDVAPIFVRHCLQCHSSDSKQGDLSLATPVDLIRHDYVIPNDAASSHLLTVVSAAENGKPEMPKKGRPLSDSEVDVLHQWVEAGAVWPKGHVLQPDVESEKSWWSFQPPVAAGPPTIDDAPAAWRVNPIDAFILQKLRSSGLDHSPEADRRTLIRRVTLDMTGLPPAIDDVTAFVNASGDIDAAYAQVVDRLLESPRYGERWAQHWLDVIRWAETVGFETNLERPKAWPYRDWVIESLNADKPYDQFVFEQIAGDTVGADAALGFLVAGPANLPGQIGRDEPAMRQARQDELDEVIRTVSQSLFGLTIGCARCHDHKFDPITQHDYYAMQAIFSGLTYGERRLRGEQNDEWTARLPDARHRLEELQKVRESLQVEFGLESPLEDVQRERFEPVVASAVRMLIAATGNNSPASLYEFEVYSTPDDGQPPVNVALASSGAKPSASGFALANQTRHFDNLVDGSIDKRQAFPWVSDKGGPAWIQVDFAKPQKIDQVVWHKGSSTPVDYQIEVQSEQGGDWIEVATTKRRLPRIDDLRPAEQVRLAEISPDDVARIVENSAAIHSAQAEVNRFSAGPQVYAARFDEQPEVTWLLQRGDPMQRADSIEPSVPAVLTEVVKHESLPDKRANREADRRLGLAKHLTNSDHPLTARVIVNRVWQHHFGTGLVETPSDFGRMGTEPSHPELLDWLAVDFVNHGWSLKHLHRMIVTSQTYRQSSRPSADAVRIDADSRLLWRFPPRRLEAEAIRDAILFVSGRLNLKMGGPGFDFFNQRGGLSDYKAIETFNEQGWRRMVYAHKIRMQAVDIFGAFDCPDAGQMKPSRTRSITPLQSLSLLNSPFINRQAEFFAERIVEEAGDDPDAQVDRAFQLAFSREPGESERKQLVRLATNHGLEQVCRVILNTSEVVFLR